MPHHASVKKAQEKGILLEDAPEGSDYRFRAFWPERAMELWGSNQGDLVNNAIYARMMVLEHGIKFEQEDDTITVNYGEHELGTFEADLKATEFYDEVGKCLEELPDAIEAAKAEEVEGGEAAGEAAEEEEEGARGSVVPEKYKTRYKEEGHAGHCGDWLAETLIKYTVNAETGLLNVDAIDAIAQANGVDTAKWNRTTNGWQGRLRMTARNAMVKKLMVKGVLFVPAPYSGSDDMELTVPDGWLAQMALKYKINEPGDKKRARK